MITHRKTNDQRRTVHGGSVKSYRCVKCGRQEASSGLTPYLRCPDCEKKGIGAAWMKIDSIIPERKADEIRNRLNIKSDKDQLYKPSPTADLWDEGKIRHPIKATVYPITGEGKIEIEGKRNKLMWLDKIVKVNNGWYRLSDIGIALKEMI